LANQINDCERADLAAGPKERALFPRHLRLNLELWWISFFNGKIEGVKTMTKKKWRWLNIFTGRWDDTSAAP
jgi:hypothetical protein